MVKSLTKTGFFGWQGMLITALCLFIMAGTVRAEGSGGLERADPRDRKLVAMGEQLYAEHCASCHGTGLEGQDTWWKRNADGSYPAPPHNELGHTWEHSDRTLFLQIKYGGGFMATPGFHAAMPAFGGKLSDREILGVIAYIKTTWPEDLRRRQEWINNRVKHGGKDR